MRLSVVIILAVLTAWAIVLNVPTLGKEPADAAIGGAAIYADRCAICHEASGQGIPGTYPPLAGNPHVTAADPSAAIAAVLNGELVDITVRGHRYIGGMPGWRNFLSDADAAAVVTYIRKSWGNGASPVSAAQVARIRAASSTVSP